MIFSLSSNKGTGALSKGEYWVMSVEYWVIMITSAFLFSVCPIILGDLFHHSIFRKNQQSIYIN